MKDIQHHVLDKISIFKVHQSKNESIVYSILAVLYSDKMERRTFHQPSAYKKYWKLLNVKNIPFSIKNKQIFYFLNNNPQLDITIRLFDSVAISGSNMEIFDYKTIGKKKTS